MQSNVDEILAAAEAITFDDREGYEVSFDLVTARNFKESSRERILLVGHRQWRKAEKADTGGRQYNGYWVYPVHIYVPANPRDHEDYTDFTEAENAADALLNELLPASEWELEDSDYYPAQMSSRELVAADIEVRKFKTRRFLGS